MRRQRGGAKLITAIAAVVILALAAGGALLYGREQLKAPDPGSSKPVSVNVVQGETLDQLANDLQSRGLIRSVFWFELFARFKGLPGRLQPGRYDVSADMGASAVVAKLSGAPDAPPRTVTLAEGLTLNEMADKVAAAGIGVTRDQYIAATKQQYDEPFLASRPAGDTSLEGFLFPDTYTLPVNGTAHDLVQMQLDDFKRRAWPLLQGRSDAYSVLITASIVEHEAQFPDDLPKVASVIDNRLAQGMNLQVDATVLYGLGKVGQPMSQQDAQTDTPYNTYLHSGLPPTPIGNPGLATLKAALSPAQTGWLYYVSDGCGHNHYATTFDEHQQNISKYLGKPCSSASATP